MEMLRIIGVGVVAAVAAIVLRSTKPELAFAVSVCAAVVILIFVLDSFKDTLGVLFEIGNVSGIDDELIKRLLKIIGVGYLVEFAGGVLNDFGANGIAEKVILGGKICILTMSLPIIKSLFNLVVALLKLV